MNRLNFLKKIGSFVGITFLTSSLLEACSSSKPEEEILLTEEEIPLTEDEILYNEWKNKTAENGKYLDGRNLYIDVTHEKFSSLKMPGEFVNDFDNYILILRKTESLFQVFSNCCPHLGTFNQWSYLEGRFRCSNHGNSYGTSKAGIARCGSGSTSGNLKQYQTTQNQDLLIVDFES
jgi:Rieske Fe-S protein